MPEIEDLARVTIAFRDALAGLEREHKKAEQQIRTYKETVQELIMNAVELHKKLEDIRFFFRMHDRELHDPLSLLTALSAIEKNSAWIHAWIGTIKRLADMHVVDKVLCWNTDRLLQEMLSLHSKVEMNLSDALRKRYNRIIDVNAANQSLEGKINLRVIFNPQRALTEDRKRVTKPDLSVDILRATSRLGYGIEQYLHLVTDMTTKAIIQILKENPIVFTRAFGQRVQTTITIIFEHRERGTATFLVPFKMIFGKDTTRGTIVQSFLVSPKDIRIIIAINRFYEGHLNIGTERMISLFSRIIAHEMTHALDKRVFDEATVFDKVRAEGVAMIAEMMRDANQVKRMLSKDKLASLHTWSALVELQGDLYENTKLRYTLGTIMCLGILCLFLKREKMYPTNPYRLDEMTALFTEPQFRGLVERTYRQILAMDTVTFFAVYQKAVAEGVAPKLFSEELLAEIATQR